MQFDKSFKQYLRDCAFVNQFYIESRYPADVPLELSKEEALECISITSHIKKIVLEKSNNIEFQNEDENEPEM